MSGPFGDDWLSRAEAKDVVGAYRLWLTATPNGKVIRRKYYRNRVFYYADDVYAVAEAAGILQEGVAAQRRQERQTRERAKEKERVERLWGDLALAVAHRPRCHAEKALGWVFTAGEVAARLRAEAATIPVMKQLGARLKARDYEIYSGLPYGLVLEAFRLGVIPEISLESVDVLRERAEALYKVGGMT